MNINKINSQKGIAQFLVIAVMAFLALGIPTATKLVQQNQENRSNAASMTDNYLTNKIDNKIDKKFDNKLNNEICGVVKTESLSATTDIDNPSILCKSGSVWKYSIFTPTCQDSDCDELPQNLKEKYYKWTCVNTTEPKKQHLNIDDTEKQNSQNTNVIASCRSISENVTPVLDAYLYFNPKNQIYKIGDTVKVIVGINSGLNKISGADVIGTFDSSKLELISIDKSPSIVFGDKGDCVISKDIVPDKFMFSCYVNDNSLSKVVKGDLVYLTFKAKSVGLVKMEFSCEQSKINDSNIINSNPAEDLILCDKNINANYKIINTNLIPASSIEATPTNLKLKVDQSEDLIYTLTPSDSNDPIKWTVSTDSLVKIQKTALMCSDSSNSKCLETSGTNHLQVTALKAGTAKIKLTTSSGKYAEVTVVIDKEPQSEVVNGACGNVKYSALTETSDKDNPQLLCKSGKVTNFSKMTPNCSSASNSSNCPPAFYNWTCLGSNDGKSVKCTIKNSILVTGIKVTPTSLKLKVGKTAKISYVLIPKDTTDSVNLTIVGPKNTIKITEINSTSPGTKNYKVTALKSGSVKVYFKTSSGKSASTTILINK